MTTNKYDPLLIMVFKIRFLRAMTDKLADGDLSAFIKICIAISNGTAAKETFIELDAIYEKFEKFHHMLKKEECDATKIS